MVIIYFNSIMVDKMRYNDDSYFNLVMGNAFGILLARLEARNRA